MFIVVHVNDLYQPLYNAVLKIYHQRKLINSHCYVAMLALNLCKALAKMIYEKHFTFQQQTYNEFKFLRCNDFNKRL